MAFLPECRKYDDRLKLITEIGRLHNQNKQINMMSVKQFLQDMGDHIIQMNG